LLPQGYALEAMWKQRRNYSERVRVTKSR